MVNKTYEFKYLDGSALKNTCRGCLKTGEDIRAMTADEENAYQHFVKDANVTSNLCVCVYCGRLLRKLSKFALQCHEANRILSNSLDKDIKPEIPLSPLVLCHNLATTATQIIDAQVDHEPDTLPTFTTQLIDIQVQQEPEPATFDDDRAFDDEDMPLVMLKKEDGADNAVKRSKKKKVKDRLVDVQTPEDSGTHIEAEPAVAQSDGRRKQTRQPKKALREGFSSRMVQETPEYVVIKLTKEQVIQEMEERSRTEKYQRTLYKCHKCVKGFNFEDVLRTHMEKHSMENGTFQCEICSQYCPSVVSLRGHLKSHTTRYQCKVCGCVRQARQHLLEHHTTHTPAAPAYSCHICDFATTKRTSIQRHVKSHRPTERHTCHQCGKLFKSLETLRVHTLRHDKSKRLLCGVCGCGFVSPALLQHHVEAAHVRRDYYCVECDRAFRSRDNLKLHFKKNKRHRDVSSYQYTCVQCPRRFASAAALVAHAQTHASRDRPPSRKSFIAPQGREHTSVLNAQNKKLEETMPPDLNETTQIED